jgi:hypothetical protein
MNGRQGQLEYDFVVAPGKSASRIQLAFTGMDRVTVDPDGTLVLVTDAGFANLNPSLIRRSMANVVR